MLGARNLGLYLMGKLGFNSPEGMALIGLKTMANSPEKSHEFRQELLNILNNLEAL
jgi:hypothetical protein